MSRSGYSDDWDETMWAWRGAVASAIRGKRGQKFLKELAHAMDAMEEKVLIANKLINEDGDCCAIGVVCKSRGIDVSNANPEDPHQVGRLVDIAEALAAEIEYLNDEYCYHPESPGERWVRMRQWVDKQIKESDAE